MVRETRHLWVGNLPDNIREDRIREHFKRYGRVQNVKLLGRTENATVGVGNIGNSGICATVAFMDIKSASKAHNVEHVLDERTLTTEYYEPAAIPSAAGAPSAGSSPAGSGYSGSSSSVNSTPAPASVSRYHMTGGEDGTGTTCPLAASAAAPAAWRGTNDSATEYSRRGNTPAAYSRYQRNNSTAPYSTPPSNVERTTPHHRWYVGTDRGATATGGESTPSTPGGGTESGRRRRHSGSGSSRSDSSSPEPSDTSRASTPATQPTMTHHTNHRVQHQHQLQWAATASGRPLAICVRNLPTRSTDSSLKDGLYHEYKKHGKVVWVKVVGQNADRYAVVRFKKPSDVEKALEVSQDKLFFGCKISVAPHQSCDEDADSAKPYETDIDEYHPKATRTLFIGNLEKDVTQQQLREKFKHFGRIIEIDIKKGSGGGAGYAFCQYASISSVVEAIRAMDGEYVGGSRVKLGFGKPVATTCVWVDGLTEHTEKQVLGAVSRCGAATSVCVDRAAGAALVHFEQAAAAGTAVRELRRVAAAISAAEPDHPRLCVDYASRECQEAFYEQLEKHGGSAALTGSERLAGDLSTRYLPSTRHEPIRYDGCGSVRSRASSFGRASSRTPRYSAVDHYDPTDFAADRRYRVYDETGSSPPPEETTYEDRLQSVVVSPHRVRKHCRDSSSEDKKHSKERHLRTSIRRSRSGSRGAGSERHGARRKHRKRRDGSGSRAGTPLRDEPDALPVEPRRPPRERPPLPMSLPLPKFAAQLLRTAPSTPRPMPTSAPDSPPRPPSVSSSSGGSAPHSPSLEERIRSLDEKYEKWSGSRALADAPDRTRFRHRLLDIDINEVKPSEVVRSLLAKRSVFDEDSERLESVVRPPSPSPGGSPRSRSSCSTLRALRYPYSITSSQIPQLSSHLVLNVHGSAPLLNFVDGENEMTDRPADPRLNRPERLVRIEKLGTFNERDYRLESRGRPRTPSTDRSQPDSSDRISPGLSKDLSEESKEDLERIYRDSLSRICDDDKKSFVDNAVKEDEVTDLDYSKLSDLSSLSVSKSHSECLLPSLPSENVEFNEDRGTAESAALNMVDKSARDVLDMLLHRIEQIDENNKSKLHSEKKNEGSNENNISSEHHERVEDRLSITTDSNLEVKSQPMKDCDQGTEAFVTTDIDKEIDEGRKFKHNNSINSLKITEVFELAREAVRPPEKNYKEKCNHNILDNLQRNKLKEESTDNPLEEDIYLNYTKSLKCNEKKRDLEKNFDDRTRIDRDKSYSIKDRLDRDKSENEKFKTEKTLYKNDKNINSKVDFCVDNKHLKKPDKLKLGRHLENTIKDKIEDNDNEKIIKHYEDKIPRQDHHKKDKIEKDKRKNSFDDSLLKLRKDERHKHERSKKDSDLKRESKKECELNRIRKSSRDETAKEINRKDSTDSSTSRTSHDSSKVKDFEGIEIKQEIKCKLRQIDPIGKIDVEKDFLLKSVDLKLDCGEDKVKTHLKTDIKEKEEKDSLEHHSSSNIENNVETYIKFKSEITEKQRHYSLDSPNTDTKRKERLNSCSSLPPNIGHKRRMSSQESFEYINEDFKKYKSNVKFPDRRESKDSRNADRHKTAKFSKGHFAKIIESKTKDDKKSQVKPPDDTCKEHSKENDIKQLSHFDKLLLAKTGTKEINDKVNAEIHQEGLYDNFDFLATLELRSSEEDEKQKALRKEMKEKKRIQQLQQIQELQMQQDALQQSELVVKTKDDKKHKNEERKKEAAREKRMSTDRKSREEKTENIKRKNRKVQSSDSSDSDEPKKHSIFDIIDDGPTYISMYDKVKARSCKNMQKQEEEKRQEKIKAKFSQLKQCRAKREEKKRSSWDEDSDSDQDKRNTQKLSIDDSSDDDITTNKKHDSSNFCNLEYTIKNNEYIDIPIDEEHLSNKLTRKNSRTRIISDTSDDETSRRSVLKSPTYTIEVKKECISDSDSLSVNKNDGMDVEDCCGKTKKNSLLTLFGKSDGEDSKTKYNLDINEFKACTTKSVSHEFSSESESIISCRNLAEIHKKHKKKQKKHKPMYSDDETKTENKDSNLQDSENKHRNVEKQRRHSNKKEKRKDKIRESVDTDDNREDKIKLKKDRKSPSNQGFDYITDISSTCVKKEGKMEDIFGPLSDDSDPGVHIKMKSDSTSKDPDSNNSNINTINKKMNIECNLKEKDESKRRKERKRKEKQIFKDDDNSLDVDAVSKAIEARLFAESITDDENRITVEPLKESVIPKDVTVMNNTHLSDSNLVDNFINSEKLKKDCKEKRKKKKKNREDRLNRHFYNQNKLDKSGHDLSNIHNLDVSSKFNNSLSNDTKSVSHMSDDCKLLSVSPSLPRLTDSPPMLNNPETNNKRGSSPYEIKPENSIILSKSDNNVDTEVMSTPKLLENIDKNENEDLLTDNIQMRSDQDKSDLFVSTFGSESSEDAVRSICNLENKIDKIDENPTEIHDIRVLEKKLDEKPRAVISQEETEDAVAALLGESFGGKVDTFANCYEKSEDICSNDNEIVNAVVENENIPEEDAEEMRQAVQNLNASEMEIKPDTPVSDNDLLLIDTDTEDLEESAQDAIDKLPINIIATSQSLNTQLEHTKAAEVTNIIIAKPIPPVQSINTQPNDSPNKFIETEAKVHVTKTDNTQTKTSTATPVITSWTLTNNKILEPRLLNMPGSSLPPREKNENKPHIITPNLVQIKKSQSMQVNSSLRPIVAPTMVSTSYQVINQLIRPQVSNLQPPTIKIPEPHILYQKPQNIVISPRPSSNDPRLLSPKATSQAENVTSPRMNNMGILSTTSPNLTASGLLSPNTSVQQRSPSQMTVVRMQQPPLSPIQTVHLSHGARAMVSPNRANSVLVQAQRTPIHFNRLPVTPILAPISKQVNLTNIIQQNKNIGVNSSIIHTPKIITGENKKNDQKNVNETSKIILSPTNLQHSTNPTVMAQNRLISMQNAIQVGGVNNTLHINNKVLINTISQSNDKKENQILNSEQLCKSIPFSPTPIHVTGVNHSTASTVQSITNPIVCGLQDSNSWKRHQNSNVMHTNSERVMTSSTLGNVTHFDTNKGNSSLLSIASSNRSSMVLSNVESSIPIKTDNMNLSSKILKTINHSEPSQCYMKIDAGSSAVQPTTSIKSNPCRDSNVKMEEKLNNNISFSDLPNKENILEPAINMTKDETDFEELLKDNTNEIKITNDPEKILEVNVGKTVTLFPTKVENLDKLNNKESVNDEIKKIIIEDKKFCDQKLSEDQSSQYIVNDKVDKGISVNKSVCDAGTAVQNTPTSFGNIRSNDICSATTSVPKENKTPISEINEDNQEDLSKCSKIDEIETITNQTNLSESIDNHIKNIEENDTWNTNDINIESVIKKVDYLCNENTDFNDNNSDENKKDIRQSSESELNVFASDKIFDTQSTVVPNNFENLITDSGTFQETITEKPFPAAKRGGRSLRGKKTDRSQDRVQTRQISKPSRGTGTGKRGRGRGKVDKKIKTFVKINSNNIPGDVYDFHEDSGDETTASLSKAEVRPRLILTIKSPLSGNSSMTATSTLSIAQKDQNKIIENLNKEEKSEDFISPSPNTRKSRRLQEKDVQRSSVDEVIEDVVKVSSTQAKVVKETNKKRQTRLIAAKAMQQEKTSTDTRKSPRGVKRTRDRSLSDASVDSGDEKILRKDDNCTVAKVPRLQEPITAAGEEPDSPAATRTIASSATTIHSVVHTSAVVSVVAVASTHVSGPEAVSVPTPTAVLTTAISYPGPSGVPTPITKPPKKMISEISAKLACVFEAQQQTSGGEAQHGGEAAPGRRVLDSVPPALMPVGATEASDARVLSPALPHRPPSTPSMPSVPSTTSVHRPADRATPILVRNGEGEGVSGGAGTGVAAATSARGYRPYLGTASLPRGAHHPPPDPLHQHVKQVAVVGPHLRHHHPGTASRVTVTNVPSISPQSQMSLSEGMYPHFSHQHYQMYQQHFRATQQEIRTSASPFTRSLEAEGCEAPTPPLELRRPPSARVPRPAHSPAPLPSHPPQDRLIMYGASVGAAGTGGTRCARSPPPAHGTPHGPPHGAVHGTHGTHGVPHMSVHGIPHVPAHVPSHGSAHITPHGPRATSALPSVTAQGPPHASQVPREADSLQMLLRRYPVMWQGLLALKNDSAAVQMHFVGGNPGVAGDTLSRHADHSTPLLRIAQRMRLEPAQLDQVHRKMKMENEHCMLLALPCGRDHMDVLQQSTNLTAGFITYLQRKQAAGIVNIAPPGHHQAMFTVHIFPSCDFANENLNRIAPDLMHRVADIAHLLIVIATV